MAKVRFEELFPWELARAMAAAPICYLTGGIEAGERYHVPGSMFWIRPETFRHLLLDIYEAMRRRGFRAIVVVAGHWSPRVYLPTVRATGAAFRENHPGLGWLL